MEGSIYQFSAETIGGEMVSMAAFKGKALLIVNTASKCSFTPQYQELEEVYQKYKRRGFEVLGFPCNQFGQQEPGDSAHIAKFCLLNYGVSFPMFAKIDVNGPNAHPIFRYLCKSLPGVMGSESIKWNFTKFFIDRAGQPVKRFATYQSPVAIMEKMTSYL